MHRESRDSQGQWYIGSRSVAHSAKAMLKVRGMALAASRAYVKERFREAQWAGFVRQLPPEHVAEVWEALILPTGWYDVAVLNSFLAEAEARFRKEEPRFGAQLGQRMGRGDIKFYHALVMPFLSPARVLAQVARLWQQYWNAGAMAVIERNDTSVRIRLDNPGVPQILCAEIIPGWGVAAIEATGSRVVRVEQVACVLAGAPSCEFIAEWT